MKASLLILLLFFSCLSFVSAQKKYIVKVTTLDNKVYKGLMFQVREKDFLILPNGVRWNLKVMKDNISRTKSFDFGLVKQIKIRKQGRVGKAILIGLGVGFIGGTIIVNNSVKNKASSNDKIGLSATIKAIEVILKAMGIITLTGTLGGVIGSSYPHKFEVKKDSTSIQKLKTELKKYEWYRADESVLK